ncbi:MAG TPA: HlyD family efflux transporter periplasmic adaptor subunit [Xanthobacteraceae bacterium]|jgi:membrane fusion protein
MNDLFRKEAISHATQRLAGGVVLATPLSVRVLGLFFGAIILAAVVAVSTATYARKATVTGWLVPDQGLIRATAASAGFVQAMFVKEGQTVEAGATLAQLRTGADAVGGNVSEMFLTQLRAEADATRARTQTQLERLSAESQQASVRLAKSRLELEQLARQLELQAQRVQLARQELARGRDLAAKGIVAKADLEKRQAAVLAAEQDHAALRRQIDTLERDMSDIEARIGAIPIEKETVLAESRSSLASLEQRSIDAETRWSQTVLSPVAGRVAALPVSLGQGISAGATVAIVIPDGAKIEAELLAPSRAAGFIRPGQEVHLMLQAFPYQRFGTVKGRISAISRTVLGPTEIAIPGLKVEEPVFRVRVTLPREDIQAYGEAMPLQPGMLLSADIVFDRRSLIRWLFDPLFAVGRRT